MLQTKDLQVWNDKKQCKWWQNVLFLAELSLQWSLSRHLDTNSVQMIDTIQAKGHGSTVNPINYIYTKKMTKGKSKKKKKDKNFIHGWLSSHVQDCHKYSQECKHLVWSWKPDSANCLWRDEVCQKALWLNK